MRSIFLISICLIYITISFQLLSVDASCRSCCLSGNDPNKCATAFYDINKASHVNGICCGYGYDFHNEEVPICCGDDSTCGQEKVI
jgi:hypothetical protein